MKLKRSTGIVALFGAVASPSATLAMAQSAQPVASDKARPVVDPNQKVCETVTVVGSRLGQKRICATRAEWADKRKQDKETVDQAQRSANIGCSTTGTLSSTPSC